MPQGSSKIIGTISIDASVSGRSKYGFICVRFHGANTSIAELHLTAESSTNAQCLSVSYTQGYVSPNWSICLPISSGSTVTLSSWSVVTYSVDIYWEYYLFY